jgi:ABC-2 type transport system permease protein
MFKKVQNIYQLGCKELWSLWRDPAMLVLIIYTFTISVYNASTAVKDTLNMAPIAIVDEDHSTLSERISSTFYPPNFISKTTTLGTMDAGMDAGEFTFAVNIPSNFQSDVLSGDAAEIQVNVDATRMSQAMSGAGYFQQIIQSEVNEYVLPQFEVKIVAPKYLTYENPKFIATIDARYTHGKPINGLLKLTLKQRYFYPNPGSFIRFFFFKF